MKTLFKALTKTGPNEAKWVQGLPTFDYDGSKKINGIDTGKEYFPILPETLCQAVGKLDKTGKDLFEKDRVRFSRKIGKETITEELTVFFDEDTSQLVVGKQGALLPLHMYNVAEGEIFGNENDDLFLAKPKKRGSKK